jgi:putative membrane protein
MIMKKLVIAAALLALATPAVAQNAAPANPQNAQQGSVSPATQKFVDTAAITDMFEIQAGQLAQQKVTDAAYKDFAQMTIADHTKTTDQLKSMAPTIQGLQLPQDIDSEHKAKIDKLSSLSGAAFARQYRADQVQGHRQAIAMFERYAKTGDNADLKSWADQTLPTLKMHLQHAEALPRLGPAPTTGSGTSR